MELHRTKLTKVICTMGPAVDGETTLKSLIEEGMDIARINCGHDNRDAHRARINRLKKVRSELGAPTAIMLDMRGPSIRTGLLADHEPIRLQAGKQITLTEDAVEGTERLIGQTCAGLASYMRPGTSILIDDGLIELAVDEVVGTDIVCTVQNTGMLGERRSLNFPGTRIDLPVLSGTDKEDLLFGIENGVDYVAVPYVRSADDVQTVRAYLEQNGGDFIGVIAKVERPEALEVIGEIIEASDGVIIARGDLGVEMDAQDVPHIQKRIVELCNRKRVPVVTASQMLDSMMREPRPTRAEVADVANAVYDGTDALMLSGETAVGKYPVPALRMMVKIALASERHGELSTPDAEPDDASEQVSPSVGRAAVQTAHDIDARCIVTPTSSGRTARLISNLRPDVPIYAVAHDEHIMRRMQLYRGVTPILGGSAGASIGQTIQVAQRAVLDAGLAADGDLAVFTAGDPHTGPSVLPGDEQCGSYVGTSVMYVVQIRDTSAKEGE